MTALLVPVDELLTAQPVEVCLGSCLGHPREFLDECCVAGGVAGQAVVIALAVNRVVVDFDVQNTAVDAQFFGQVPVVIEVVVVRVLEQAGFGDPDLKLVEGTPEVEQPGGFRLAQQAVGLPGADANGFTELFRRVVFVVDHPQAGFLGIRFDFAPQPADDVVDECAQVNAVFAGQVTVEAHERPHCSVFFPLDRNVRMELTFNPLLVRVFIQNRCFHRAKNGEFLCTS